MDSLIPDVHTDTKIMMIVRIFAVSPLSVSERFLARKIPIDVVDSNINTLRNNIDWISPLNFFNNPPPKRFGIDIEFEIIVFMVFVQCLSSVQS